MVTTRGSAVGPGQVDDQRSVAPCEPRSQFPARYRDQANGAAAGVSVEQLAGQLAALRRAFTDASDLSTEVRPMTWKDASNSRAVSMGRASSPVHALAPGSASLRTGCALMLAVRALPFPRLRR